jgi:hypothetical protein
MSQPNRAANKKLAADSGAYKSRKQSDVIVH